MAKATTGKTRTVKKKTTTRTAASTQIEEPPAEPAPEEPKVEEPTVAPDTGAIDAETHAKYEEIKRGDIHIKELQRMTVQELHEVAKQEGLEEYTGLKKEEEQIQGGRRRSLPRSSSP